MQFLSLERGGPGGWTVRVYSGYVIWNASNVWRSFIGGESVAELAKDYGVSHDGIEEMLRIYINRKEHAKAARSNRA